MNCAGSYLPADAQPERWIRPEEYPCHICGAEVHLYATLEASHKTIWHLEPHDDSRPPALVASEWIADVTDACWTCGGDHYSEGCPNA